MSPPNPSPDPGSTTLRREVGLIGSIGIGMGAIVGTGVFVSIGIAAEVAGPAVMVACVLGALVVVYVFKKLLLG